MKQYALCNVLPAKGLFISRILEHLQDESKLADNRALHHSVKPMFYVSCHKMQTEPYNDTGNSMFCEKQTTHTVNVNFFRPSHYNTSHIIIHQNSGEENSAQ